MWPLIAAYLGSAALSYLGSARDRSVQNKINSQNVGFQQTENALNRKFAREQMFGEQGFNAAEAQKLRDWSFDMYKRQYHDNSLMAQAKQARDAGVNPFAIFGNGAFNGASQPSSSAASSSVPMTQGVAPHVDMIQGSYQRSFSAFSQVAMALDSLSKFGLNDVQRESIMKKLQPEIDRLIAETNDKEQSAAIKEIQANLDSYFGFAEREKKLEGLNHEVESLFKKLTQQDLDISESQFQQSLQDMRRELMIQQKRLNDNTFKQAEITLDNLQESFTSLFRLRYAQKDAALASAEQSHESAVDIRATRDLRLKILDLEKELDANDNAFEKQTFQDRIEQFMNETEKQGIVIDDLREQLEYARKNNDWYAYHQILGGLRDVLVGAAAGATLGARSKGSPRLRGKNVETYKSPHGNSRQETYFYDD